MKSILTITCLASLSACATTQPALQSGSSEFGVAVRQNIAAQAVAPTARQKADTYIPADATKRAKARESYRNGETPEPTPITTTD
ncbi:hypothetical protein [Hellea balneolensis]|uniref:hypothetical protein n=1 Tax=Hellea balneolensis TaxID=287478 RepID=UPI0003F54FFB|nr:hypothetical protein [Hellea balneolensis]